MSAPALAVRANARREVQARGAHFLSHDLASAFLAWFVSLALYRGMRRQTWRH